MSMTNENHIIINEDRSVTVPNELKNIAVQYDHNIRTVVFDCPRYWYGSDISNMQVSINYTLPDDTPGKYKCANVTIDENDETLVHFEWDILCDVTRIAGKIKFIVCITLLDGENGSRTGHSRICPDLNILNGLECDAAEIVLDYDAGYKQGQEEEHSKFWDSFQDYGKRTDYRNCFASEYWTRYNFNPKYNIYAANIAFGGNGVFYGFNKNHEPVDLEEIFVRNGITFDFSLTSNYSNMFHGANISRLPKLVLYPETNSSISCADMFSLATNLRALHMEIKRDISNTSGMFRHCDSLKDLTITTNGGYIVANNTNVQWSDLTYESIFSLVMAHENKTKDTSGTVWTIILGSKNMAKVSEEERDMALNGLGWVLQ